MTAIRRVLPLLALLPLGGCVLAVGNSPDDKRFHALEKRLDALEKRQHHGFMPAQAFTIQGGECKDVKVMGGECQDVKVLGGKVLFIGPDGKKTEVDLEGGEVEVEVETRVEDAKPPK